jgi:hypothetical protein
VRESLRRPDQYFIHIDMRRLAHAVEHGVGDVHALQLPHRTGPGIQRLLRRCVRDMFAQLGLHRTRFDHADADVVFVYFLA